MIYVKEENGKIIEVFETNSREMAEANGFTTPCEREVVKVHNGYKYADEVTDADFLPTQAELNAEEIERLKAEISATDYKCLKYVDGAISESEYAEVKAYRAELRRRINELENV